MKFSRLVLVDMDDVVAGFYTEAYKRIQKLDKNINAHKKSSSYFFEEEYPKYTQEIRDIFHSVGFFANLPIIKGSLEGWQKLLDNGYDPVFCSSPLLTSPYCIEEKKQWIKENFVPLFGHSVLDRAILTRHKHREKGIALIDDKPEIYNSESAQWMHILFESEFNLDSDNTHRISGWNDDRLLGYLEIARENYINNHGGNEL